MSHETQKTNQSKDSSNSRRQRKYWQKARAKWKQVGEASTGKCSLAKSELSLKALQTSAITTEQHQW